MSTLSLYASGYRAFYDRDRSPRCPYRRQGGCDEEEVSALTYTQQHGTGDPENPRQSWWPRTADFVAEARKHSGNPTGVANTTALIRIIQSSRNLNRVILFAHGWSGEIQFGSGQRLTGADVARLPNISASFAAGGTLDLYACNAGLSDGFLQGLANRLGVRVRGFNRGVRWNLRWDGDAPHRRIISRGIDGRLPEPNVTKSPA